MLTSNIYINYLLLTIKLVIKQDKKLKLLQGKLYNTKIN